MINANNFFQSPSHVKVPSTQQAVVVGCSCQNQGCSHHLHPSATDFFSIDIDPKIKPNICMDFAKDNVPTTLHDRFKLTILEYLPFYAYNKDCFMQHFYNIDGTLGMENAKKITADDGFIMIVGNSRTMHFRKSLADTKYLEIGASEENFYVVLIPKNQNLDEKEVLEQMNQLPKPLRDSIQSAITSEGCQPTHQNRYCKLNYHVSLRNQHLIEELDLYISERMRQPEYKTEVKICGHVFTFGFSMTEKISAASALISVLLGNQPLASVEQYKDVLDNGNLSTIVSKHTSHNLISELISNDVASSDSFTLIF